MKWISSDPDQYETGTIETVFKTGPSFCIVPVRGGFKLVSFRWSTRKRGRETLADMGTYRTQADAKMAAEERRARKNPAAANRDDYSAKAIGESNAHMALDSYSRGKHRSDYASHTAALAAYLVNTCDTAREYRVSREAAVEAFLKYIQSKRKPRAKR